MNPSEQGNPVSTPNQNEGSVSPQPGAYCGATRRTGPKPKHIAPESAVLVRTIALHDCLADVCRHYGIPRKTLHRWMLERSIERAPTRKQRPRGITPRYVRIANSPNGSRIKARLYQIWDSMHKRCYYPKQNRYERYGGRGIAVCAEWHEYDTFRAWAVSHGYAKGLTLDRKNGDGNYEPNNCRWIPVSRQQWNTSRTIFLTAGGVTRPLPEWATLMGVSRELLRQRRREGWTEQQIIETPIGMPRIGFVPQKRGRKPRTLSSSEGSAKR